MTVRAVPDLPIHCLSFDVEEHFQVSAFDSVARRHRWDDFESRVEPNTDKILQLLSDTNQHATFFILGWIAERHPRLVLRILDAGHEVASHGYGHELVTTLTRDQFRADVRRARAILESIIGQRVYGYRAPSFTIVKDTSWAHEILVEEGYAYDSSVFPIVHDVYGMRGANPDPHQIDTPAGPIWELPPATTVFARVRIPVGGGGYFRLCPYSVFRRLLKGVEVSGRQLMLYFHPWELDPGQPRMRGSRLSQFRHYVNLDKVEPRLERLMTDFRFGSVRHVVPHAAAS
ncbi:MAG: XrtA system polysaccharide deacetylase [Acidimicrobiia bacterium]